MPYVISRQQAISEINKLIKPGKCLVCALLGCEETHTIHAGKLTTVVLSGYPRTWGQTMVLLNAHKTVVSEITNEEWQELTDNVRRTAVILETVLKPLRCYIASLGATENLPNTCPHLHFNVLPIYSSADKPSDIFTWQQGVYAAEKMEWIHLLDTLKLAWEREYGVQSY
jgi:diadenosine tetraphosphate (Ap4A) HIT family hydrolase